MTAQFSSSHPSGLNVAFASAEAAIERPWRCTSGSAASKLITVPAFHIIPGQDCEAGNEHDEDLCYYNSRSVRFC